MSERVHARGWTHLPHGWCVRAGVWNLESSGFDTLLLPFLAASAATFLGSSVAFVRADTRAADTHKGRRNPIQAHEHSRCTASKVGAVNGDELIFERGW